MPSGENNRRGVKYTIAHRMKAELENGINYNIYRTQPISLKHAQPLHLSMIVEEMETKEKFRFMFSFLYSIELKSI